MKNLFNKRQSAYLKASFEILHEGVPKLGLQINNPADRGSRMPFLSICALLIVQEIIFGR